MEFRGEREFHIPVRPRARVSRRLFYFAKMRVYCLPQGEREEMFLCLFMVGKWPVDRPRRKRPRDPRRHHRAAAAVDVTAIAAAVFFLDATKKYGRIITSFAVVPLALARVARVVKSVMLTPPAVRPPIVFLPRRCGRSCQIFIAPTSLSRGADARNRLALYGTGTTRKEKDGLHLENRIDDAASSRWTSTDCEGLRRELYKRDNKSNKM